MWKKIWEWLKKYGGYIASAFLFVIGILVGRKQSVSGADVMVKQLRDQIDALGRELSELRLDNNRLQQLSREDNFELGRIEDELERTRGSIEFAGRTITEGGELTESIKHDLDGFRAVLERNREDLEKIKVQE